MKTISGTELLGTLEQRVEKHITQCITVFQNLSDEKLLKPAVDGGWSIAQCLEHLNSYGRYYLPAIQRAILHPSGNGSNQKFTSGWLGNYFTRMMEPGTSAKKYRSPKNHVPVPQLDAQAVVAEFIQQQEQMIQYLRTAKAIDISATRVPISLSKWIRLKLGDTFCFVIAHNERHLQQAKRHLMTKDIGATAV